MRTEGDEIADRFETDVEATEELGNDDPLRVASDAAVGGDFPELKASGEQLYAWQLTCL